MLLELTLIVHLLCVTIYMYWPLSYSSFIINDHFNSNMCLIILLGYSILIYHQTEHNINTFKESWHKYYYTKKVNNKFLPISFQSLIFIQIPNTNFPQCTQLFINYNSFKKNKKKIGSFCGMVVTGPCGRNNYM